MATIGAKDPCNEFWTWPKVDFFPPRAYVAREPAAPASSSSINLIPKEGVMRKMLVGLSIIMAFSVLLPPDVKAKAPYCLRALEGCYAACRDYYNWELSRSACYGGCLIGYATCG